MCEDPFLETFDSFIIHFILAFFLNIFNFKNFLLIFWESFISYVHFKIWTIWHHYYPLYSQTVTKPSSPLILKLNQYTIPFAITSLSLSHSFIHYALLMQKTFFLIYENLICVPKGC